MQNAKREEISGNNSALKSAFTQFSPNTTKKSYV